jgi:hypothetical protein
MEFSAMEPTVKCAVLALLATLALAQAGQLAPARAACSPRFVFCNPDYPPTNPVPVKSSTQPSKPKGHPR